MLVAGTAASGGRVENEAGSANQEGSGRFPAVPRHGHGNEQMPPAPTSTACGCGRAVSPQGLRSWQPGATQPTASTIFLYPCNQGQDHPRAITPGTASHSCDEF